MNNKLTLGGIFCDTEKHFNCVNDILPSKMEFYSISSKEKTLKQYLNNRYPTVSINRSITLYYLNGLKLNTACHKVPSLDQCQFSYIYMINLR